MLRYKLYLNDILKAINKIEESTKNKSFETFNSDNTLVDASAMRLQIIGESLRKIPSKFKKNKEINWKDLQDLRNIISHAYFRIDNELLFDTIKSKIPSLKKEIEKILQQTK